MGDLLMTLPVVRSLRRSFPKTKLVLLMKQELHPLLEGHPDLDGIIPYDSSEGQGWRATLQWGKRLKAHRFDTVLIANPTRLFHVASFLAGIPRRIGYRRKWGFLLTAGIPDTKAARKGHEADYNLELLPLLEIPSSSAELVLSVSPEQEKEAAQWLEPGSVALHPWASNPAKALPLSFFEETARELASKGVKLLWIGEPGPGEKPPSKEGAIDLTGQVPLRLLPALLKQCALLISNDSGPVHVAAGVGTPALVVAPESHRPALERWAPLGKGHQLLFSPQPAQTAAAALEILSKRSLDADRSGLRK